jgi:hypothetical protein
MSLSVPGAPPATSVVSPERLSWQPRSGRRKGRPVRSAEAAKPKSRAQRGQTPRGQRAKRDGCAKRSRCAKRGNPARSAGFRAQRLVVLRAARENVRSTVVAGAGQAGASLPPRRPAPGRRRLAGQGWSEATSAKPTPKAPLRCESPPVQSAATTATQDSATTEDHSNEQAAKNETHQAKPANHKATTSGKQRPTAGTSDEQRPTAGTSKQSKGPTEKPPATAT